jgi:menaquinone-9 beta-reductase
MARLSVSDVIIVGGGIAGSCLAGVLARAGLGVLVVEKEARFRDRIRGEGTWPWGVVEARRAGLGDVLNQAGAVEIRLLKSYQNRQPMETIWERSAPGDVPGIGFSHPQFQEAAFQWAAAQGATMFRPAKAIRFAANGTPALAIVTDGRETEYRARLIVGADGKLSAARRWTGGGSLADPEHHRMGGVLVHGATIARDWDNLFWTPGEAVNWFAAGAEATRLYLVMRPERLRETGVDRSFAALVAYASPFMPEGALAEARQAGPIGFFPNADTWASRIAGNGVVLIGDAAGAPDPTGGHGTALLFRDVRALSEALLSERDWDAAITQFADDRARAYAVIHAVDQWMNGFFETSDAAARLREGNERARQHDPTLGGFAAIEPCGPDGLVADEAARRHYFGEDLA